ncbi:MAG: hypothetical protein ACJAVM_002090 [Sulfitobacter sp.]|jgi:hypothetical protein
MIIRLKHLLRRFRKDQDGSALVIEFCIFVPILFGAFLMSVEMGIYSMRQMYLDRGLDIAVRYVRLHTNTAMDHNMIKGIICGNIGFVENCQSTLRLEMTPVNPRNFSGFAQQADCVDTSEPVKPVRGFSLGQQHEMMLLRACIKFDPIFPTSGLGYAFDKDGSGQAKMFATAAFVQEPG